MFQNIGEMVLLFWRTLCALPLVWRQRAKVLEQFYEIGNASLLMICVLSFFLGGVLALQTGPLLAERGLHNAVGGLVGIAMAKEFAAQARRLAELEGLLDQRLKMGDRRVEVANRAVDQAEQDIGTALDGLAR